jgi:hypothetical protein
MKTITHLEHHVLTVTMRVRQRYLPDPKRWPRRVAGLLFVGMLGLVLVAVSNIARAECREYTPEQRWLIESARHIGAELDWSYTLAAMVEVESFVGDQVVRVNPTDGQGGSYGVMHMLPTTGLHILGLPDTPENRSWIRYRLVTDDIFAIELGYQYFLSHLWRGWRGAIMRYNGAGWQAERHADRVITVVRQMQRCRK